MKTLIISSLHYLIFSKGADQWTSILLIVNLKILTLLNQTGDSFRVRSNRTHDEISVNSIK